MSIDRMSRAGIVLAAVVLLASFPRPVQADLGSVWTTNLTDNSVTINWNTPSANDWCLDNPPQYKVCWKRTWTANFACNVNMALTSANSYTITGLQAKTEYKFKVEAHSRDRTRAGCFWWLWRDVNEVTLTTRDVPAAPVVASVRVASVTPHSLQVRVDYSRPADFETIRVGYRTKWYWVWIDLYHSLQATAYPGTYWGNSNGHRGWTDSPSASVVNVTLSSLPKCRDFKIMAFGFPHGAAQGTFIGETTGATTGNCGIFKTYDQGVLDNDDVVSADYADYLSDFYSASSVGDARDISIAGGVAYEADSMRGLVVSDVLRRDHPFETDQVGLAGATDVAVNGDRAYVAHGANLSVVDVADPANVAVLGTYTGGSPLLDVALLASDPEHVYLARGTNGIAVLDVSAPAAPVLVGSESSVPAYSLAAVERSSHWHVDTFHVPAGGGSRAMWCGTTFANACGSGYGNGWNDGLVFQYSVPNPNVNTIANLDFAFNCDSEPGHDFFQVQQNRGGTWEDLGTYSGVLTNATFSQDVTFTPSDYVGEAGDKLEFRLLATSDGATSDEDCLRPSSGLVQVDNIVVTIGAVIFNETFEDEISDDWQPQEFRGLAVASGNGGLSSYDLSVSAAPQFLWNVPTSGPAGGVAVSGAQVLVACGTAGMDVFTYDTAEPLGHLASLGDIREVCFAPEQGAYVVSSSGVHAVSLADPAHPQLVLSDPITTAQGVVGGADGTAYVAGGTAGLRIYDDPQEGDTELVLVGLADPTVSGLYQHLLSEYPELAEGGRAVEADYGDLEDVAGTLEWLLESRPDIYSAWQADPALVGAGLDLLGFLQAHYPATYDSMSTTAERWVDVTAPPVDIATNAFGLAWGDYDGDGDEDLYVCHGEDTVYSNRLLRNDGAFAFTDITTPTLGLLGHWSRAAAWADIDNDGDLDLFVTTAESSSDHLLRNDGGVFTDITAGPLANYGDGYDCDWADVDLDGRVDLYVTNLGNPSRLLRNLGGGLFADISDGVTGATRNGTGASFADYDNDGDPDLYLTDYQQSNRLLRNDGGSFTEVTTPVLADGNAGHQGAAWADVDNDGDLDLYLCNGDPADQNRLLRNDGGSFTDITAGPLAELAESQGQAWGDFDNDGDLDLFLAMQGPGSKLLRNDMGTFVDHTSTPLGEPLGEPAVSQAAGFSDVDGDGGLDLYVTNHARSNRLYWGLSGDDGSWLRVALRGVSSNRAGIGARVRVVTDGEAQVREIGAGAGYLAQQGLEAHFGLGGAAEIDTLEVRWPSGLVQALVHVAVDSRVVITEGTSVEVTEAEPLPQAYALLPVYPNPFNPRTTIRYEMPGTDRVTLAVYDIRGRLVRGLESGVQRSAGVHEVSWDGRDENGAVVPSGVYFCRMHTSRFDESQRMVLLK